MCTLLMAALMACTPPLVPAENEMVSKDYFQHAVFYYEISALREWEITPVPEVSPHILSSNLRLMPLPYEEYPDADLTAAQDRLSYGIVRTNVSTLSGRSWRSDLPIEQRQRKIFGVSFTFPFSAER